MKNFLQKLHFSGKNIKIFGIILKKRQIFSQNSCKKHYFSIKNLTKITKFCYNFKKNINFSRKITQKPQFFAIIIDFL